MTIGAQLASTRYRIEEQPLPSRRQRLTNLRRALEIERGGKGLHDRAEDQLSTLLFAANPSFILCSHTLPLAEPPASTPSTQIIYNAFYKVIPSEPTW